MCDLCDVAKMYVTITWWQEVVTGHIAADHELKGFHLFSGGHSNKDIPILLQTYRVEINLCIQLNDMF